MLFMVNPSKEAGNGLWIVIGMNCELLRYRVVA